ncbi:MAG TPA: phosphoribosyltransferase family protein [Nitrososphaera sp.]|nr:phosphoribosyltransferase family protein [Nitrososphaera sp.]
MFADRCDAAERLANRLSWLKGAIYTQEDIDSGHNPLIVLAIPRRGVIIGEIIGTALGAKLDLVVSRKIRAPLNPELAIGAVMPDGTCFLDAGNVEALQVSQEYIDAEVNRQTREIARRLISYRGRMDYENDIEGKIVILVDDGVATGSTVMAAAQWIRAQACRQLIIAVPVGPKDAIEMLQDIADVILVLEVPGSFDAVGEYYQDFPQVTDWEVKAIMRKHGYAVGLGESAVE